MLELAMLGGNALYNWFRGPVGVNVDPANFKVEETTPKVQNFGALVLRNSPASKYSAPLSSKEITPLSSALVPVSGAPAEKSSKRPFFQRYLPTMPLLALPFALSAGSSANVLGAASSAAEGAGSGEGFFSNMYTGAKTAFGFAWSNLGWGTKVGLGVAGALGVAYLVHKYWRSSGINITNNNNNTNTVHFTLKGEPGMRVVQEEKDGKVFYTVEESDDQLIAKIRQVMKEERRDLAVTMRQVLKEVRARKAAAAAA